MAKKSVELEQELAALKAKIAAQRAREQQAGEHELLKLVRRAGCLSEAIAWAKSRADTGRRNAHTDTEVDHANAH